MGFLKVLAILVLCAHSTLAIWTLKYMATKYIPSDYINNNERQYQYDQGAANSVAYDPSASYAYVAGNKFIQVVDYSRFIAPNIVHKEKTASQATDIAHCGYIVAWVTRGAKITDPGTLHVWDKYRRNTKRWNNICTGPVGSDPVSIKFFDNCQTIVVANKGSAALDPGTGSFIDPEGTISIVRIKKNRQQMQQQRQQPGRGNPNFQGGNAPTNPNFQGGNPNFQGGNPNFQGGNNPTNPNFQGGNPNFQGGNNPTNPNFQGGNPNFQGGNNPTNPNFQGGNTPNNPNFQGGNTPNNPNFQGGNNPTFQGGNPNFQGGNNPNFQGGNNPTFQGGNNPTFQGGNQGGNQGFPGAGGNPNFPGTGGNPNFPGAGRNPNFPGAGRNPNFPGRRTNFPTTQGTCATQFGHRMTITTVDFRSYNTRTNMPSLYGVRMPYDGSLSANSPRTLSKSLEPSSISEHPSRPDIAVVSLTPNNAVVQITLTEGYEGVSSFSAVGLKPWNNYSLDASSTPAGISFNRGYNIYSLRQPSAIEPFVMRTRWGTEQFLFTADEGATTKYGGNQGDPPRFSDAVPYSRLRQLPQYLPANYSSPRELGQLEMSRVDGLRNPANPNSGYDYVNFFGGRGISMFRFLNDSNLALAWDSQDQIARGVADTFPMVHNSRSFTPDAQSHGPKSQRDLASTQLGAQCKSLAVANVERDTTLVFVGADGPSVIGIFSVSSNGSFPNFESVYRKSPVPGTFSQLLNQKQMGDIDPAKLVFIPRSSTPDRFNYLMVMGKKSGTLSMYRILKESRRNMLNRLRKEANSATSVKRSVSAILFSIIVAAVTYLF
ncbi:mesenchyme-specific cell surface glycoprotein-like [Lytechinus pictus]|uniref:mesenchyme-specific cell surface glycoprotein-like n=1 Tax=Lytechinus pictus TaxID=7653 RepID=UPI0030BA1EAF